MSTRWQAASLAWAGIAICLAAGGAGSNLLETTDPQREVDLGRQVARQVELMMPLSTDQTAQARVQRVGQAVVEQLESKIYPYQFKVLAVGDYNAFAIPGGFIYVYEGLLDQVEGDDELAFVLAHEVAHVARRHWAKRTEDMKGVSFLSGLAAAAIGGDSDLVAALASTLIYLRYSRADENDADEMAMEYLWRAGFDPAGAVAAMEGIVELEKGQSVPKYLRNHPPARDRLARLEQKRKELAARPRPGAASSAGLQEGTALRGLGASLPGVVLAQNPWLPLAVGNRWTYATQRQGLPGASAQAGGRTSYRVEVIGEIPCPGGTAYRTITSFASSSVACQMLTSESQVWVRGRGEGPEGEWRLEYVTDLAAGEVLAQEGWEYQVVGTEPISVPCGNFAEARRVRKSRVASSGQPSLTMEMWFVGGVGGWGKHRWERMRGQVRGGRERSAPAPDAAANWW